jgi:hypothetical protein
VVEAARIALLSAPLWCCCCCLGSELDGVDRRRKGRGNPWAAASIRRLRSITYGSGSSSVAGRLLNQSRQSILDRAVEIHSKAQYCSKFRKYCSCYCSNTRHCSTRSGLSHRISIGRLRGDKNHGTIANSDDLIPSLTTSS